MMDKNNVNVVVEAHKAFVELTSDPRYLRDLARKLEDIVVEIDSRDGAGSPTDYVVCGVNCTVTDFEDFLYYADTDLAYSVELGCFTAYYNCDCWSDRQLMVWVYERLYQAVYGVEWQLP